MTDDIRENIYNPKDVARQLDISESTLRKYNLLLEDEGYTFKKNARGQRAYYDSDIIAIRRMTDLRDGGMTLKEAAHVIYRTVNSNKEDNAETTLTVMENDRYVEHYDELKSMIQQQTDLIQGLTDRLDQQEKYISNSINERDRNLMLTLNELMDSKREIAAAEKKGFFARLFKR